MQRRQIVVLVEGAGQLALRDRMIGAVLHVVFARPQQLDRRARHLLGDRDRLPDIVGHAAPAEAAAEHQLVHLAFFGRQARGFQHRGERRFAVLRSGPDLAFVRRIKRRGVQRLHRGVVLVRIVVDRLDLLGGAGDRGLGVAVLVADEGRAANCRGPRPAIWRSTRWRPWRSRLRPRRSAAHRARSWRATRCRRRRRRCCR